VPILILRSTALLSLFSIYINIFIRDLIRLISPLLGIIYIIIIILLLIATYNSKGS